MAIANIITRGYGLFSAIKYIVTRGYLASSAPVVPVDTHDPGIKRHHVYALTDAQKRRLQEKLRKALARRRRAEEEKYPAPVVLPIEEEILENIEVVAKKLPEPVRLDFIAMLNASPMWEDLKNALTFALEYQKEKAKRDEEDMEFLFFAALAA